MIQQLEQTIIRVLDNQGRTLAAGMVVNEHLAVACSHTIEEAGSYPGQSISIQFFTTGRFQTAQVLHEGWSSRDADDVAFLQLESLPSRVVPAILGTAERRSGHQYIALGFPDVTLFMAYWAHDTILGIVPNPSAHPCLQLRGEGTLRGMSGAPVQDIQSGRVVGMINAYQDFPNLRIAWAITSDTLATYNPTLRLWPDSYGPNDENVIRAQERLQLVKLRQILTTNFSESELRDLCFDFEVDYEVLSGEGKGGKSRELIAYFERRGRVAELIEVCRKLRPNIVF